MKKIPYFILALNIEKLYQKELPEHDTKAIAQHCEYINKFIESCGWTSEEYMERWMQEQEDN